MIQQNIIASTSQPIEIHKARIRSHNTILSIIVILGITLILSLYVYQASALYMTRLAIHSSEQDYARQQRLNAESLILLARTQSMETMIHRAQSSGYGPPKADQIKYVNIDNGQPSFVRIHEVAARE